MSCGEAMRRLDSEKKLAIAVVVFTLLIPLLMVLAFLGTDVLNFQADPVLQSVLLISMVPFIIISAYMMFTGKGAFLVAGYNTSSAAKKATYDEKALSKAVGRLTFVFMVLLLLGIEAMILWESMLLFWILTGASFVILIVGLLHANLSPSVRRSPPVPLPEGEHRKQQKLTLAIVSIAAVVILVAVMASGMLGASVDMEINDDRLEVKAPMLSMSIAFEDIDNISYLTDFDIGRRSFGYAGGDIYSGTFKNSQLGSYDLACYRSVDVFIMVEHGGKYLVFNQASVEDTLAAYNELLTRL